MKLVLWLSLAMLFSRYLIRLTDWVAFMLWKHVVLYAWELVKPKPGGLVWWVVDELGFHKFRKGEHPSDYVRERGGWPPPPSARK